MIIPNLTERAYIALSATKDGQTDVMVFSNEQSSLDAMKDLTKLGNKCRRFFTDVDAFIAYSEGKELSIELSNSEDGTPVRKLVAA